MDDRSGKPLFLVHWEPDEAAELAAPLAEIGYQVHIESGSADMACATVLNCMPLAAIVSLDRDPSRGCDLVCQLRSAGALDETPVVFVGGLPADVAEATRLVPESTAVRRDDLPWVVKRLTRDH